MTPQIYPARAGRRGRTRWPRRERARSRHIPCGDGVEARIMETLILWIGPISCPSRTAWKKARKKD